MTTLSELLANRKQAINVTSSEPALKVTQNGSGDALRVEDISGDATPFVIDADGNVGIGGTTTGHKISVAQTAATHAVASLYNADTTATYNTDLQLNNANIAGNALLSRRTNGEFWLYTSAAHPIAFYTNSAERMRIDSGGIATFYNSVVVSTSAKNIPLTDNDMSFDMAVKNNFICTPTGSGTLAFTNITAGQSGNILFTNGANYAIAKNSYIKSDASFLSTISSTGTYYITYFSPDGTNVYVSTTGALS